MLVGKDGRPILQSKVQNSSPHASQAQVDGTKDCELHSQLDPVHHHRTESLPFCGQLACQADLVSPVLPVQNTIRFYFCIFRTWRLSHENKKRIRSGQRLYEHFMRINGLGAKLTEI